jgi:hypothetical protein
MAQVSRAEKAGLDVSLVQEKSGRWRIRLTDGQGVEVYNRDFGTKGSAHTAARQWVVDTYQVDVQETEPIQPPKGKQKGSSLGPTPSNLVTVMRARADDNEEKAIALRAQAGYLETEAKRLREAADTLGGPDGHT